MLGGGIAGLAAAWALGRGGAEVELLEREPTLGAHSSGRNAAIFRCLHESVGSLPLALRSAALLDELLGGRDAWLRPTGVLYVARTGAPLLALERLARDHPLPYRTVGRDGLRKLAPALEGGAAECGLFCPAEGVMDTHAILLALAAAVRAAGGRIRTGCAATAILRDARGVCAVALESGERLPCSSVVIAAGAWSAEVGAAAGAPLPLVPLRRHLAVLEPRPSIAPGGPVVWCLDDELYLRAEGGGVLASPCDESPCPPGVPDTQGEALVTLGMKLARTAPQLADSGVRRTWAGLRTFAPDRAPVIGRDPQLPGLFWLAGLGGQGMSIGAAAGEMLATVAAGRPHALQQCYAPARWSGPPSGARPSLLRADRVG